MDGPAPPPTRRADPRAPLGLHGLLALLVGAVPGVAQQPAPPEPESARGEELLPSGDVFAALLADPKQPQFFGAYLFVSSSDSSARLASVGMGESIGLVRGRSGGWQLGLATGVFSQFEMRAPAYNLINTDFIVGVPLTVRIGRWAARLRLYHQSSHLGDEYLLTTNPARENLSFEAIELLLAVEFGRWRAYAGGENLVRRDPSALKPGVAHAGAEYRGTAALARIGRLGAGRLVAAADVKLAEQRKWRLAVSLRAGIEFGPLREGRGSGRRWSAQVHVFDGPAPYGQFYGTDIAAVGAGMHFSL